MINLSSQPPFGQVGTDGLKIGQIMWNPTPSQLESYNKSIDLINANRKEGQEKKTFRNPNLKWKGFLLNSKEVKHGEEVRIDNNIVGKIDKIEDVKDRTEAYEKKYGKGKYFYFIVILFSLLFVAPVFSQTSIADSLCENKYRRIYSELAVEALNISEAYHKLVVNKKNLKKKPFDYRPDKESRINEKMTYLSDLRMWTSYKFEKVEEGTCVAYEATRLLTDEGLQLVSPDTLWIYPSFKYEEFMQWKLDRL